MNLGFGGEDNSGIYHSVYDDFYWYTHFSDTSFVYGKALAQTTGIAVMRLANADVIPYDYTDLAETVQGLRRRAQDARERHGDQCGAAQSPDRRQHFHAAQRSASSACRAEARLTRSAHQFRATRKRRRLVHPRVGTLPYCDQPRDERNRRLRQGQRGALGSERLFLSDNGLPHRPWFKHLLYAPGFYTGYGVKTIPGVREAIEQKEWKLAESEMTRSRKPLMTRPRSWIARRA